MPLSMELTRFSRRQSGTIAKLHSGIIFAPALTSIRNQIFESKGDQF
jgi:hypothetical protein